MQQPDMSDHLLPSHLLNLLSLADSIVVHHEGWDLDFSTKLLELSPLFCSGFHQFDPVAVSHPESRVYLTMHSPVLLLLLNYYVLRPEG